MPSFNAKQLTVVILCMTQKDLIRFMNRLNIFERAKTDPKGSTIFYRDAELHSCLNMLSALDFDESSMSIRSNTINNFFWRYRHEIFEYDFLPAAPYMSSKYHRQIINSNRPFRAALTYVDYPNDRNPFLFTPEKFCNFIQSLDDVEHFRLFEAGNKALCQALLTRDYSVPEGKFPHLRIFFV